MKVLKISFILTLSAFIIIFIFSIVTQQHTIEAINVSDCDKNGFNCLYIDERCLCLGYSYCDCPGCDDTCIGLKYRCNMNTYRSVGPVRPF